MPTVPTVYEVPLLLEEEGLADLIVESLSLKATQRDMSEWRKMVEAIRAPKETAEDRGCRQVRRPA